MDLGGYNCTQKSIGILNVINVRYALNIFKILYFIFLNAYFITNIYRELQKPEYKTNTGVGSPAWMAPEVVLAEYKDSSGEQPYYDQKIDVWAIGKCVIIKDKMFCILKYQKKN